jgi:hypothetical protein
MSLQNNSQNILA